jgi:iron complex transport system substrate-binding protein
MDHPANHQRPDQPFTPFAPSARTTRRRLLLGTAGAAVALGLIACGSDDDAGGSSTAGTATSSAAAGAYPLTIKHALGSTTIPSAPQRVVTYGYTDQDPVLALGTIPVGTLQWIPQWKRGVGVWAEKDLGTAQPEIYSGSTIDFEGIAAARPDLITIVTYALPKADYDKLSQIAPTVPTVAGFPDWGVPWQSATEQIGRALGKPEEARKLVTDTEALFAKAKADHPGFAGREVLMVAPDAGKVSVFAPTDTRGRFVTSLGLEQPADVAKVTGDRFYADISAERLDLIDVDALILLADDPAAARKLLAQPEFQRLSVVRDGRVITVDDIDLSMALSASSVLSIPYALKRIVPQLETALAKA